VTYSDADLAKLREAIVGHTLDVSESDLFAELRADVGHERATRIARVAELLRAGFDQAEIAERVGCSLRTVEGDLALADPRRSSRQVAA
jgi:DNA-binding NarL/FixJ family response regulator